VCEATARAVVQVRLMLSHTPLHYVT
jgi:hypothetical protein